MKKMLTGIISGLLLATSAVAQENKTNPFTHTIIVGYNLGATLPVYLPEEIRSVDSYWPQFTPQLGYGMSYRLSGAWSLESGISLDIKGMGVRDRVKYMYTDVNMDGNNIKGYFTGRNETEVKITYATVPLQIGYQLNDNWKIKAGGYLSYRSSSEFSGTVWGGYLRKTEDKDIINSEKVDIEEKGTAVFDFGKELRDFDFGLIGGFEHRLNRKFGLYTNLSYGLISVFPSDFKGVDLKMRNVYATVGMKYVL